MECDTRWTCQISTLSVNICKGKKRGEGGLTPKGGRGDEFWENNNNFHVRVPANIHTKLDNNPSIFKKYGFFFWRRRRGFSPWGTFFFMYYIFSFKVFLWLPRRRKKILHVLLRTLSVCKMKCFMNHNIISCKAH